METQNEIFLRTRFSLDELKMEEPSIKLAEKARKAVLARKALPVTEKNKWNLGFFRLEFKVHHAGFAAVIIAGCVLFLTKKEYQHSYSSYGESLTNTTASKSNTVLASLTEYDSKSSVKSSTVLTSIITFIAKN